MKNKTSVYYETWFWSWDPKQVRFFVVDALYFCMKFINLHIYINSNQNTNIFWAECIWNVVCKIAVVVLVFLVVYTHVKKTPQIPPSSTCSPTEYQQATDISHSSSDHLSIYFSYVTVENSFRFRGLCEINTSIFVICVNSSPPGHNGHNFADGIFRWIYMNEMVCILIHWFFFRKGPFDNNPTFLKIMAWGWQAIDWPNAHPIRWRIYAALWGDTLIHILCKTGVSQSLLSTLSEKISLFISPIVPYVQQIITFLRMIFFLFSPRLLRHRVTISRQC